MTNEVRIRFVKVGRTKYISHLDLMRTMTRAVRRAGIPVWYTEGFNRHPYMTFAAPLSLGFESLAESMDVRLTEDMPTDEIIDRMNKVLPDGLSVYAVGEPIMKAGAIEFARYRLLFKNNIGGLPVFINLESVTVEKCSKKGNVRQIELTPFLKKAICSQSDKGYVMELTLTYGTQTVNPALVVDAYQDYISQCSEQHIDVFCDIKRLDLLNGKGKSFI